MKPRTRSTYDFIRVYYDEFGIAPTMREIKNGTGISSTSVVSCHIRKLMAEGLVKRIHGRSTARNIIPANIQELP